MNLQLPARRLAGAARTTHMLPATQQRRSIWTPWGKSKATEQAQGQALGPLDKAIMEKQKEAKAIERLRNNQQGKSIFDDEPGADTKGPSAAMESSAADGSNAAGMPEVSTLREHMRRATDPDPRWRVRYQKRKVMQMLRSGREPTREELIRQRERQVVSQSPPLPTSTKKLTMLARQIVGKTVDEAITQMKFSKKKAAREVRYELERARDLAVVERGMGLGVHNGEFLAKPRQITTKEGRIVEVSDPTSLYVDESWIGKGPYRGVRIQYHARSRMSGMWKPTTRLSVVLKEEKTRIRQHDERVEKKAKAKPWIHLPNRPVTAQRPYYTW
ncbi:Ribosomal protein L22p/L17e [Microdochium nivale]|nr:Ribosomal protein L22p/L17e [Microdochium nivale]